MATQILSEPVRTGEHLVSEVGTMSREVGLVATGPAAKYSPGTVMGKLTATSKLVQLAPNATDGSQNADCVLYAAVDATGSDQRATINVRLTEVNGLILTWPTGITGVQQTAAIAQLAAKGIQVRT